MLALAVLLGMLLRVCIADVDPSINLATFTPLEDAPTSTNPFFAVSTQPASPSSCIDGCFNNATGGGRQSGCAGISGQYGCICTFPALMQQFSSCMSTSCALDTATLQQTLANVQQICAGCTSDGCNAFSISGGGSFGGTVTVTRSAAAATPTQSGSLCYSTTQSVWTSSVNGQGGAVGGGFFSAGPVPCASSASPSAQISTRTALSDAAVPSGSSGNSSTTTTNAAVQHVPSRIWGIVGALALSLL
ncbi:hypothetical protein C8R44DRAFT_882197 [Mycena epipterygia]|nr:hypothetical protein C8R44DRAFT_882197 [Mycena epipterygia]